VTEWSVRRLDGKSTIDRTAEFKDVYSEVYREPPYEEGEEQAADFAFHLPEQCEQLGFSMVIAEATDRSLIGFAYGLTFASERWWRHASDEPEVTKGHPKFGIMEFVIRSPWRGRRIGTALMSLLLSDRDERYGTLCVNPRAAAAAIYSAWGWQPVGSTNPPHVGPMEVLVKPLAASAILPGYD
jgi:GNAT superfamily N-acetyltransferase